MRTKADWWELSGDPQLNYVFLIIGIVLFLAALAVSVLLLIPLALIILVIYVVHWANSQPTVHLPRTTQTLPTAPLAFPDPEEFAKHFLATLADDWKEKTHTYPHRGLLIQFSAAATVLYENEYFHQPPPAPETADRIDNARYLDTLALRQRKIATVEPIEAFIGIAAAAFQNFCSHLSPIAFGDTLDAPPSPKITTPLISAIVDLPEALEGLILPFQQEAAHQHRLYDTLQHAFVQNSLDVGGLPSEIKKKTDPRAWFFDTPFAPIFDIDLPWTLPDEIRFAGHWIIAPPGSGKTTLLHAMVTDDIEKDASIILLDSKGELIEPFRKMPTIRDRLIIIGPDNPIGINPLDIPTTDINKTVENIEYLFSSLLEFKLTASQSMLLKAVLRALVTAIPKPTLGTFRDLLANGPQEYAQYIAQLEPDLQNFFVKEFNTDNIRARRNEVLQRLRLLLDNDIIRSMLLAPFTTFRIDEAMDQGKIIIIDNSAERLGDQAAEFFGRFFIAQILVAAQKRSRRRPDQKKPAYIYIDECHTVISRDEKIPKIIHECRSQKIALIMAHQEVTQITSEHVLGALQNCAVRYANPDEEARKLSGPLRTTPEFLQSLRRGQFAAYVRDLTKTAVVINVTKTDFSKYSRILVPPQPAAHTPEPEEPIVNFDPRPPEMEPWRPDDADKRKASAPDKPLRENEDEGPTTDKASRPPSLPQSSAKSTAPNDDSEKPSEEWSDKW